MLEKIKKVLKTDILKKQEPTGNPNFTIKDITPQIWAEMEQEFYSKFEFGKLYIPNEEPNKWAEILPWAQVGLLSILLIKSFF